ncbi:MAG TPA: ATP-binding protein [Polyangiaceae bacterium]|jgi:two-component system sensor histidine kinase HydH|nr:ATP-binding protein [Polyangiaceae bacterium]
MTSSAMDRSLSLESTVARRASQLFEEHRLSVFKRGDRLFAYLMIGQWLFGIGLSLVYSPYAWAGKQQSVHVHVYAAVFLGALISSLPIALVLLRPGSALTRNVVAVAQVLWSALLIHLTGGRIETHFHVFGSLAFLAFYRDWRVIIVATLVVAADHLLRGVLWPESVYGIVNPEWWRFLEHASWVAFEDTILILGMAENIKEMRAMALRRAEIETLSERLAESEGEKSRALDAALSDLERSHQVVLKSEKLAAVGQLAASVGHELRNPLAAVRNAAAYVSKRLKTPTGASDPKVQQFLGIIDRELSVTAKIISDLLEFAREKAPQLQPCPLRPLVEEAIGLVSAGRVQIDNQVPAELPIPQLDRDQFRQVLINLIQNAVEAMPQSRDNGRVTIRAELSGLNALRLSVADNGGGIPNDASTRIFEPLFTTKTKGTGLGLAIVANMIRAHQGSIEVESAPGDGATFIIDLPMNIVSAA